ncbi:MAG: hypothetical protein ACRDKW_01555, partial [Actinomycetota bacterium]
MGVFDKVLNIGEGRRFGKYVGLKDEVNDLESKIAPLSDGELRDRTTEFRKRLAEGEGIDDLLAEAYAVVREAAQRT